MNREKPLCEKKKKKRRKVKMERMKIVKILAIVMIATTAIYVGIEAYAYSNSSMGDVLYAADLYPSEPVTWYPPEELGIVQVIEYENTTSVHINVDKEKEPFPLQEVQPIFRYNEKFYKVSPLWMGYPVPPNLPQQPFGAVSCGIGWLGIGILWLKWRKEDEATNSS